MKKTPFHQVGLNHGAQMMELFGYYLPWQYSTGHEKEHLGTRTCASLCDLDYMGEFLVEGPGALDLVQKLATNDFSKRGIGAIGYTAMCDENGNMIDDCTIWHLEDQKYMIVSGDEGDFEWVSAQSASFDVSVKNITSEHTTLALQGPFSRDVLQPLVTADLAALKYYHFVPSQVDGIECLVARMGYTGEYGFELHFDPAHGEHVWKAVMNADPEIVPLGQAALESLRQEAGYLLVGNDHDKATNPLEAGIGNAVCFSKKDFNGKNALDKIAAEGVDRRLVWFDVPDGAVMKTGDAILAGNRTIGTVTSGSYSPTRGRGTAMGYVTPQHAIPGAKYGLLGAEGTHMATLSVMPLYDPGDVLTRQ